MTDYTIYLERVFRGPMDLLLHLVREQEVEIHEVEISKVLAGYLAYLDALRELDIEVAGEFLVLAATLMSIKSRSLLPREEVDLEDELDPKDELIQRLLEYRRFKEVSDQLASGLEARSRLHGRGAFPEVSEAAQAEEPMLDLGELTSWDLLATFSRLMRETLANAPVHVAGEARPMRYYVTNLAGIIKRSGALTLEQMMRAIDEEPTKETLVGAFCALLELVKIGVVTAEQGERTGEIRVRLADDALEDVDHLLDGATFEDELERAEPDEADAVPAAAAAAPEASDEDLAEN
ncbi:MAG: segregation/condensation protein A [Planctomycetes bacterium]|nr:segregation/condensation protein A [Planctomycetota bacterium]